jgi:cephalosporin hydroxylase
MHYLESALTFASVAVITGQKVVGICRDIKKIDRGSA